ncbi:probably inactive leucine-rich repeat receptor-like protein kinase At5g48380 [Durio zibethinus]|uniref:Probably inactive leucine-rich repeat receptor-like protein kinase At5g48380 n=1 Tax=Durio zibethinus TaxID=66656 RepID=A0A6P6A9F3_DURZI|nr:probably inactive leucine-rich repeat receptor-like protein kinase At5g48380 [Durio zibethinus]
MQMAPNTRLGCKVLLHILLWSLLGAVSICSEDDIRCLESIKDSLDDPHDRFKSSWTFTSKTAGFICGFVGVECWHLDSNEVLNISLTNMGLKGQFPLGIENCLRLTWLNLSNNELSGPIPSNISQILPFGAALDLSFNRFSGNIPKQISNCSFLSTLRLDNNQLTGLIPPELALLNRIKKFSVANNQLYGPVPNFSFSVSSYAGNQGLCGFPLEPCINRPNFRDSFKKGFVIGYAFSIVSVISIFMSYCVPWVHRNERKKQLRPFMLNPILNRRRNKRKHSHQTSQMLHLDLLDEASRETSMLVKLVSRMSYTDLKEATNDFSADNIIGFGQMGTTYKATLSNGCLLAIKRLFDTQKFDEHFITELKTLGTLRHDNLVPLLGFCIESREKLLVYRYMSNGNLYNWLHPSEEGEAKIIEWPLRVKIACGIARGLVWLHQNCNFRVIHLDISSKCILLDQNFKPKISNFGEAMLMKSNNTDWSSSFYMDSEFWEMSFVKEDVYRFGILLLELITGKDPSQLTNSSNTGKLVKIDLSTSSNFYHVIDKSLIGRGFDLDILQILKVACNCVHPNPDRRPAMLEVHKTISAVGKRYGGLKTGSKLTKV